MITKTQKEVIKLLLNGYNLFESFSGHSYILVKGNDVRNLRFNTVNDLKINGFILSKIDDLSHDLVHTLTAKGKMAALNLKK